MSNRPLVLSGGWVMDCGAVTDLVVDGGVIQSLDGTMPADGRGIDLTGLRVAPGFVDAHSKLHDWIAQFADVTWGSWGSYDRNQLRHDCAFHGVRYAMPEHLNFKVMFAESLELRRACGVRRALRICELSPMGTHHRGIDDARNISRLLPWAFGRAAHPNRQRT